MRLYSPQALAFLGDAVYELLVRERIVLKANRPVSELHLQAVEQVRASYQSQAYAVIEYQEGLSGRIKKCCPSGSRKGKACQM